MVSATPAAAQNFVTYRCADGSEFIAGFYSGDNRAHLQLDGKAIALTKRFSLMGTRYGRGDITLTIAKDGSATLKRGGVTIACTP